MPEIQKFRVETDKGAYIVEVDVPPPPPADAAFTDTLTRNRPNGREFLENVVGSGLNLAKGVGSILTHGLSTQQMGEGLLNRAKEYVSDIHPIEAGRQLLDLHPIQALSNLLPVEMMYQDPVGVAADVTAGVEGVRGARALAEVPTTVRNRRSQAFNSQPLATQQDRLPTTGPNPERTRTGGPPMRTGGDPPAGENISGLPLYKQQEILERSTGGPRPYEPVAGSDRRFFTPDPETPTAGPVAPAEPDWAGITASIGKGKVDLSQLGEAARQSILEQLRPSPPAASTPAAPVDRPLWDRGGGPDAPMTLAEERRMGGARSVGGRPLEQEVREATGGPSQTPLRAENAQLDADYARRLSDERGFVNLDLPQVLEGLLAGYLMHTPGARTALRLTNQTAGRFVPPAVGAASVLRHNAPSSPTR